MKSLWNLIEYLSDSHVENQETPKDHRRQEIYTKSLSSSHSQEFSRNRHDGSDDEDRHRESSWNLEAEIGDEREGWEWDCWILWW